MVLAILSGLLTGITFIFPQISFLGFFSVIPFLYTVKNNKSGFKVGFLYAFSLNLVSMSFLFSMHPLDFMGYEKGISLILVISAYLGICVFEGALIGLFAFLFKKYIKNIWLFPILYAIVEFILSLGVFGLTFSNLYLPFYTNLMFIQSAGIFGRYFITALILYINLFLLEGYKNKKYIICAILIFALNMSYGYFSMRTTFSEGPSEKITLVQGNINSNEKWDVNNIYTIMDTYKELTLDAIKKDGSKVFVWPETVVPVAINEDHYIYKTVQNFAKDNDIHIIWGVFMKENGFVSNSIIVFDNEGNQYKERYDKRHLIPFAEYNPFNNNRYIKGRGNGYKYKDRENRCTCLYRFGIQSSCVSNK